MRIHLVRHGNKKPGNFYDRKLNHNNNPISELGKDQAKLLGKFLPTAVDKVYISEFIRTQETIEPFLKRTGMIAIVDRRINEIQMGKMITLSQNEIMEQYPEFWQAYLKRDSDFTYPGGECAADVAKRIESFLNDIFIPDQEIIIVTHDGWIRVFLCIMLHLPYHDRFKFIHANCGVTTVTLESPAQLKQIERVNEHCYLGERVTIDS